MQNFEISENEKTFALCIPPPTTYHADLDRMLVDIAKRIEMMQDNRGDSATGVVEICSVFVSLTSRHPAIAHACPPYAGAVLIFSVSFRI